MQEFNGQKLNIWLVQATEPLPTICKLRTSYYADKLIEKGHDVTWFATAFDHFSKKWLFARDTDFKLPNGLKVKAIRGAGYKKNISLARYIDHRILAWKFRKMTSIMPRPDVIVASVPAYDLAYEAVLFAKKSKVPVIVDIRDPWPDIFLEHTPAFLRSLVKKALCIDFHMVRVAIASSDSLVAPTETFLEWGLKYANRERKSSDKVFPHGYKRGDTISATGSIERFKDLFNSIREKFIVLFVGTISKSYHNPYILLEVAKKSLSYDKIHFIIAGDGELFEDLKRDAKSLKNVTLTGWLDKEEIEFFLQYSKIGVCPAIKIVDLPTNKAYSYLSAGLPIISAFHGDLKRVIEKYRIGFYCPPNDADAVVNCIRLLMENKTLYADMSANAKRVFDEMFDADKVYERYAEHIECIFSDYDLRRQKQ